MRTHLTLMGGGASSGLPRQGLVALYDPYRDAYGLDATARAALQTATDYSGLATTATYGSTAGVDANDPSNTGLAFQYDGVDDVFTGTPSGTVYGYVLAGDAFGTGAGWVRGKRLKVAGRVYLGLYYNRRLTEAEYARLWVVGRQYMAQRGFAGTYYDEAWPIPCSAGVMDFGLANSPGHLWVLPDGTTSTANRPAPTLASAGTTWLYCSQWGASTLQVGDNGTNARYLGDLADAPRVTYYLDLASCSQVTGALADAPRVTYYFSLYNCSQVTGALADAPRVTYYLDLGNCSQVTGALADAPRVTYYLDLASCSQVTGALADAPRVTYNLRLYNCPQVTGALADAPRVTYNLDLYGCSKITGTLADAPMVTNTLSLYGCSKVTGTLDGTWCPTTCNLRGIGWSTAECDQSLINLAAGSLTNKTLTISAGKRSSASDAAKATLLSRGWTVNES